MFPRNWRGVALHKKEHDLCAGPVAAFRCASSFVDDTGICAVGVLFKTPSMSRNMIMIRGTERRGFWFQVAFAANESLEAFKPPTTENHSHHPACRFSPARSISALGVFSSPAISPTFSLAGETM